MPRKTETGCRPSTLINVIWAIDAAWLDDAKDQVEARMSQPTGWETVLKDSKAENEKTASQPLWELDDQGVAHIQVEGPITKYPTSMSSLFGGTSTVLVQKALRELKADPRVKALAMHYDSPGGTSEGVVELSNEIREVKKTLPVYGILGGTCCSAGYWLASQCTYLFAEPSGEIGSIGGMAVLTDSSVNYERQGLKRIVIRSEGAQLKGLGVPGTKVTPEMEKEVKSRVDAQVAYFLQDVQQGRGLSDKVMSEVKKAGVYEAKEAQRLGLVDEVAFSSQAIETIHEDLAKGVKRGHTSPAKPPSAAPRSVAMFTAEQLQRIQKLPGAEAATEATAGDLLIQVAESLQTKLAAKPAVATPEAPSAEAIEVKIEKLDLLVEKQHITKAQADTLKTALAESPVGFFAACGKVKVVDRVIETLAMGKSTFSAKETTIAQPEVVPTKVDDSPAAPDKTTEDKLAELGRKQGEDAKKAILAARGIATAA